MAAPKNQRTIIVLLRDEDAARARWAKKGWMTSRRKAAGRGADRVVVLLLNRVQAKP